MTDPKPTDRPEVDDPRVLALAKSRQQLAYENPFNVVCPSWEGLSEQEQHLSLLDARSYLRAALRAGLVPAAAPPSADQAADSPVDDMRELYAVQHAIRDAGGELTRDVHKAVDALREVWDREVRRLQELRRTSSAPTDRAAVLTEAERTMLTYALNQAQERIWSEDGFTAEDQAAVDSLRRMTTVPAPTDQATQVAELRAEVEQWRATFGRDALPGALRRLERAEANRAAILRAAADWYTRDGRHSTRMFGHQVAAELRRMADETPTAACAECGHPHTAHQDGDDPVTPGTCTLCPDDDQHHDYQPTTEARQDGAQARAVPCSAVALHVHHAPHPWEPQPGMTGIRCSGYPEDPQ